MEMKLVNRLKVMRFNNHQITQQELADKMNVSRQTINAIENGKFNPSVKLALFIADFFKCNVEDIFYLTKEE
jgi:putative transcriptional regulator